MNWKGKWPIQTDEKMLLFCVVAISNKLVNGDENTSRPSKQYTHIMNRQKEKKGTNEYDPETKLMSTTA